PCARRASVPLPRRSRAWPPPAPPTAGGVLKRAFAPAAGRSCDRRHPEPVGSSRFHLIKLQQHLGELLLQLSHAAVIDDDVCGPRCLLSLRELTRESLVE